MKFDDLTQEHLISLLSVPHQIYLVDGILKADITAFKSDITFGNINPAGLPQTAVSITLSTKDLYDIANKIIEAINSKKSEIIEHQKSFLNNLDK